MTLATSTPRTPTFCMPPNLLKEYHHRFNPDQCYHHSITQQLKSSFESEIGDIDTDL